MNGAVTDLNSLWRPYQYRGTIHDLGEPWPGTRPPLLTPEQVCGTLNGYRRHDRRHEPPCEPCRDANKAYRREIRAMRKEAA